jgi:hypothetical protein
VYQVHELFGGQTSNIAAAGMPCVRITSIAGRQAAISELKLLTKVRDAILQNLEVVTVDGDCRDVVSRLRRLREQPKIGELCSILTANTASYSLGIAILFSHCSSHKF